MSGTLENVTESARIPPSAPDAEIDPGRPADLRSSRFLRACRGLATDRVPVWYMRQAGRYEASYREIRKTKGLIDIVRDPALCAEVTLHPVRALGVDAAILFSDIMVPLGPMGVDYTLEEHVGPVLKSPVRTREDITALRRVDPEQDLPYVLETIREVTKTLARQLPSVPLIGFAGAPFTLLSYLVEGHPTRTFLETKRLMYRSPEQFRSLMERLADMVATYLAAQARAGAGALMLFDSWAGALSPDDYETHVAPHVERILRETRTLGVPRLLFGVDTAGLLEILGGLGAEVVGVDWRIPIREARKKLPPHVAVQGNLDPALLFAPREHLLARAATILSQGTTRPGFIFNLGHGVMPDTDPDALQALTRHVHAYAKGSSPPVPEGPHPDIL